MTASPALKNWLSWVLPDFISIRLFSTLGRYAPGGETQFSLPWHPAMQARDILDSLKIPETTERVILINGRYSEPDQPLFPDDIVTLFPPITGG